jgi:hypothetical protein
MKLKTSLETGGECPQIREPLPVEIWVDTAGFISHGQVLTAGYSGYLWNTVAIGGPDLQIWQLSDFKLKSPPDPNLETATYSLVGLTAVRKAASVQDHGIVREGLAPRN